MQAAMTLPDHNRPFRFFDLPREIRDEIYTLYSYTELHIPLGPKGTVSKYIGKPSDHRARLYKRYQECVSLFTISRQFRHEALPLFWQRNDFRLFGSFGDASLNQAETAMDYIGRSGKRHIANVHVNISCTVSVRKPGGSEKNGEYDTDLGTTVKGVLDILPNLKRLEIDLSCHVDREQYPGVEITEAVLQKAAGDLLEFLHPMQCFESSEKPKLVIDLFGNVAGRPIRSPKEQDIGV